MVLFWKSGAATSRISGADSGLLASFDTSMPLAVGVIMVPAEVAVAGAADQQAGGVERGQAGGADQDMIATADRRRGRSARRKAVDDVDILRADIDLAASAARRGIAQQRAIDGQASGRRQHQPSSIERNVGHGEIVRASISFGKKLLALVSAYWEYLPQVEADCTRNCWLPDVLVPSRLLAK